MATSLFSLVGSIFVDNSAANESLQKTDSKAESLGKTFLSGAKKVGQFAAGVATAATGVAVGMTKMAQETSSTLDVIDKASQRMDISAESYQELAHAVDLSGVSMTTMEKAAKKLEGTGLNMDDAINEIYALETAEERSAKAAELFGEAVAYQMSPMLNASGEAMAAMRQEAHDLGMVLDQDTVSAGAKLNDSLSNVTNALTSLGTKLGAQLMPIVQDACDFIIKALPTIQGIFDQLSPVLTSLFDTLMPQLLNLADSLLPIIFELIEMLMPLFSEICEAVLPVIVQLIETLLPPLLDIAKAVLPIVVNLITALLPILKPLIDLLNPILQLATAILTPLLSLINAILTPLANMIGKVAKVLLEKLHPIIQTVADFFTEKFNPALDKLKEKFKAVFEGIRDTIKAPINAIIGFINGLVGGVVGGVNKVIGVLNGLSFDVPDWIPGIGGQHWGFDLKELTAPQIPYLAEGAVLEPNKPFMAVVGDQKEGTNVEAPLDTIKQAVREELGTMELRIDLHLDPETKKWFKEIKAESVAEFNRTGKPQMA